MKKITLLFTTVLVSFISFAQGEFDNKVYARIGYSNPSWEPVSRFENWENGYKKYGAIFDAGTIFMFDGILSSDKTCIGLDVTYVSVYWHKFINDPSKLDVHNLRLSSKIGPSFTYSPDGKLAFDVFIKADMGWATGTAYIYNHDIEEDDVFTNFITPGWSTGFNVRIKNLMLGFEYSTISPKLENEEIQEEYLGNADDDSEKSPMPSLNFMVGVCF